MTEQAQLAREKAAFAYSTALEIGDFERVTAVLQQAEHDPILEQMLLELNEAQQEEMEANMVLKSDEMVEDGNGRDTKNTPRQWRRYLWPAAGAVGLLIVGFICFASFFVSQTGRSFSRVTSGLSSADADYDMAMEAPAAMPMEEMAEMEMGGEGADVLAYSNFDANVNPVAVQVDRLIIRNGSITVVVEDPTDVRQQIQDLVAEMADQGAFVVSSQEFGEANDLPYIHMNIRVPSTEFASTMDWLASTAVEGTNPNRSETADDVTEEYVDLSARLESMEAARDRLLEIMENAETTEDLLQAEQQLTIREAEIESIQGRLQYLQQSAALSLIDINLQPYILNQPIETGWKPAETVRSATESLINSAQGMVDFLIFSVIAILPWLLIFGLIIYLVYRFIWKRFRARSS